MTTNSKCTKCQSENILWLDEPKVFICISCANQWSKTEVLSEQSFCQRLANSKNWQNTVFEFYPAPIAHEYKQLQTILGQGHFLSAMMQLKDVVEIIVKFSTVTMYQCLAGQDFSSNSDVFKLIKAELLSKPLSLGTWLGLLRKLSCLTLSNMSHKDDSIGFIIASWFYSYPEKQDGKNEKFIQTKLYSWLDSMTEWRNKEIGHGALRLNYDKKDFDGFEKIVNQLHTLLGDKNPWDGYRLVLDNTDTNKMEMTGWESIRKRHNLLKPIAVGMHKIESNKLLLINKKNPEQKIELAPFIEAKVCSHCELKDVFIFDGIAKNKYFCIDYLSGHRLKNYISSNESLTKIIDKEDFVKFDGRDVENQTIDQNTINESLLNLFEVNSLKLESNFTTPKYLNDLLNMYLENEGFDSNLFWLQAPAHIGKSTFIKGLSDNSDTQQFTVISFHIRREYRYFAHHFTEHLYTELQKKLSKVGGNKPLPRIDLSNESGLSDNILVNWINEMWGYRPQRLSDHTLIIAIDGLDEIGKPKEGDFSQLSIIDLLPSKDSNKLDKNIHIILTSRPIEDCHRWMQSKLKDKLLDNTYKVNINKNNKGYLLVLKSHFDIKLNDLLEGVSETNRDLIFNTLIDKSESLFLYFSMLVEQISSKQLSLANVKKLPSGKELYGYFLDQLERTLGRDSKGFLAIKDMITLLTACEQALYSDINIQNQAMTFNGDIFDLGYVPLWEGIDAETLAGLLNEPHGAYSSQFIFCLFTIKSLMRVERSSENARYSIGLKEFNTYIAEKWADEINDWHKRLSTQFYEIWINADNYNYDYKLGVISKGCSRQVNISLEGDSISESNYLNRYALSHAKLAHEANKFSTLNYYKKITENKFIQRFFHHNYYVNEMNLFSRSSLEWLNLEIYCQESTSALKNKLKKYTSDDLQLAKNYIYRGDLLVYMEQEEGAQINYKLASDLCKLEWTGSYDDRLVLLLESLSKSNVNENKYDTEDYDSIENDKFKLLEHSCYLKEALVYLDNMELDTKIFDTPGFERQFCNFKQELALAEARIISQEAYQTVRRCNPGMENILIDDYDIKKVYQIYKEVIESDRPEMKLELAIQYLKLSYLIMDESYGVYNKEQFNELNYAVGLMYEILESFEPDIPLKYRYYMALLINAKWSCEIYSPYSKIINDLSNAAKILEEGKILLEENNEFIPISWNIYLSKIYNNISRLNFFNYDVVDDELAVNNQKKLLKLQESVLEKLESDYQENPTELIADRVMSSKSEILRILFYKRTYIKDKTALIELNDYSVALVKSILISDISDKKHSDFRSNLFREYLSCAISYLDLGMKKEADLIVSDVQAYHTPLIDEEIYRNKKNLDWEALSGYTSFENEIKEELIGWRENYLSCISTLTYVYEEDKLDKSRLKLKYHYIVQSKVILDSMLIDIDKFTDQISSEVHNLRLFLIIGRTIESYHHLLESQLECNQKEYGFIQYLQDIDKLINYIDKYISQISSSIDKIEFLSEKISIYKNYYLKEMYSNLKKYDALIQNIDMSIKAYEYMDEIFSNMNSHELGLISRKAIETIEVSKLKLKVEKADANIKIYNPNAALLLYIDCINTYEGILYNLPCQLPDIVPSKYAMYRNRYISNIHDIIIKMYSINKDYIKSHYDIKLEIKISTLNLDRIHLNKLYELDSVNRSSVGYIYKLQELMYWDSCLFTSTVKFDIRKASDKNSHSKFYLYYLNILDFVNEWTGNIEQDITNPSYKYHEDDIQGYIDSVALLKAQISSFTDLNLAIQQYSIVENICEALLNKDSIDYFLKIKSNLDIEYHPRVEKIYKQLLDNDKCLIELRASLAIASFGKAHAYELLDASNLYNYQMALDSYSRAISELNKINNTILGIDDYGYSNELTHFLIKVHDSRANLYNNLHNLELAKIDCEKVAQLHYTTCFSKIISIEDQVDWFLQGMLFINDTNNGFHDSRTFDLSSIEQPLKIFNYPIFKGENILLKLFQFKFDLTILNSVENSFKNNFIFLASILHTLGNALVLDAIQNNSLSKWEFSISPSVYEGDPATSAHIFSAVGQVENAFKFVKILNGHEAHYDNLRLAVKLHTQAISIMTQHDYAYNPIWDCDLSISSQLLEYKNSQSEKFDIPF